MTSMGLSKPRLQRLHDTLAGYVERRELPGLVALVSRHGDLHVDALGTLSFDGATPMPRDAIFRIASITKPVTAVAAMILIEDCRIRLDDAIDPWLPELADRHVLRDLSSALDDTVPASRPIRVRDLLTSTMGFGSVMAMPDTHPIQRAIRELRIGGDGPPRPAEAPAMDEWLRALGSLPLMAQPGERWLYHVSNDVLGALIARVSGTTLGAFMRERIFEPLGMKDTAFHVSDDRVSRLPAVYGWDAPTSRLTMFDGIENSLWGPVPPSESGGGGLVSTINDYHTFCEMLLNKGRHGDTPILSRASVELMMSDRLTREQRAGAEIFFHTHSSWGFGGAVDIRRDDVYHWPGRYGWTGGLGTIAYTDPMNGMIGMLFTQRMMDSPVPPRHFSDFFTLAYAAME